MADGTIIFNQRWQGQVIQNVTVWSNIPTTPQDRQSLADALRGSWATLLAIRQHGLWSLESVTFLYNESLPFYSVEVPFTAGVLNGGHTADALPSQAALLVSTQIVAPPPNRGRVYISGMTEADTLNGQFIQGALDDAQALVESWADGVNYGANAAFLRIARRNPAGVIILSSPVETVVPRVNPAIQRRRRRGTGI